MKRNKFSLSFYKLLTGNMGVLYPVGLTEVLPGDTIQQSTSLLIRMAPMLAPVMHPVRVAIHHWYVPHRLVWEDWEDFITGGQDGLDASQLPTRSAGTTSYAVGTLADYLGIPPLIAREHSVLPFRGYQLIWNENYRDPDLQTEAVIDLTSGTDSTTSTTLQRVAWEKDYFTTSRPWPKKGPDISIPLQYDHTGLPTVIKNSTTGAEVINAGSMGTDGAGFMLAPAGMNQVDADVTLHTSVSIEALRESLALQRWAENRARFGSRYVEYLRHLGVRSSDARLQRPEYLGGGRQTIQFSEVLQTAEGADSFVGDMKGHGISAMRSNRYRRFIEEHGYIFTLMYVRPKSMYTRGLYRTWNRRTREDFYTKELEFIGQQEVINKEVNADHSNHDGIFGYQDRYDEYRRAESQVAGEFRTSALDYWHFARSFSGDAALNSAFVSCTPTEVPFASTETDTLYIMANHSIQARRMLSARPTPRTF